MAAKRTGRTGNGWLGDIVTGGKDLIVGKKSRKQMAEDLARGWHGRDVTENYEITEIDKYPSNLAEMGILLDLCVVVSDGAGDEVLPITFSDQDYPDKSNSDNVMVCATPDRQQIVFKGGDQTIDYVQALKEVGWTASEIAAQQGKYKIVLGEVYSIGYFTDKHHLTGPKEQKRGTPYEHKFGEQGGERPVLVYDTVNKRVELVGGGYEIRDEGIWN